MALLAVGDLGVPGPNYDEVIQALPSVEFLEGRPRALALPGSEVLRLSGRPFPWMTQAYMGALKSQLLIPSFAVAGTALSVLRLTTLAWSALGLLFCIAFARRAFGPGVALVSGLLLASDPSFLFISRHDWGSFSLGFLLRCASLFFAAVWWESGRLRDALLAGAALGSASTTRSTSPPLPGGGRARASQPIAKRSCAWLGSGAPTPSERS
jgi:hypothetical protein